ncbi:sugar kinase [Schaedlerella arabinosiphila]|uniref:Sugar kinase n=1 Tax=Schaedlerella arabinosiphila TaxID=2044587 RepID=A0A9X5C7P3_9FIRM|nr:sugar kinase [Schaedlerella arabinosiphila]KAI4440518.1 putative sugar kinase YdjH [Schaedlerella arabinosiphila]MCI9632056.1 sugar kinase [Ruminococcus sp.]NDO69615.1 sugar kinase [Schaedlerella arabinosiphila]
MEKKLDAICVGAAIVDIPLQPVNRDMFEIESFPLQQISMTIGGDAINEATIMSRLGHKIGLMSMVGRDAVGNFIIEHCEKNGIDYSGIRVREGIDTSINVGLVTADGERTFVTNRNGSLWKMTIDDVDLSRLKEARLLSLASIFNNPLLDCPALVKIFKEAKAQDMIICADMIKARLGETLDDIKEALGYVDYFFPNYDEACLMTEETELEKIADRFLDCGIQHVVIKTGKKGCYIKSQDGSVLEVPAMKGITAIDTIGAGDNFASGFITAILEGKSLKECAEFANVTASISVQSIGATTGVQKREQVDERMKEYYAQQS